MSEVESEKIQNVVTDRSAWEAAEKRRDGERRNEAQSSRQACDNPLEPKGLYLGGNLNQIIENSSTESAKLLDALNRQIEITKQTKVLDVAGHLLELSTSVNALQRNHSAMEQAIAQAFGELTKGFRAEVDALAKAAGIDLPKVMRERMEAQQASQNTAGTQTPQ